MVLFSDLIAEESLTDDQFAVLIKGTILLITINKLQLIRVKRGHIIELFKICLTVYLFT